MPRQTISTDRAPRPAGVYSQGVQWERLIFTAGQVGIDPATGQAAPGGVPREARP